MQNIFRLEILFNVLKIKFNVLINVKCNKISFTLAADTKTPLRAFRLVRTSPRVHPGLPSCRSNIGIDGQNRSEKWCSSTSLFRSTGIDIDCKWLYSSGTTEGNFPALTGLLVDQARLCADPQATLFIFLPKKKIENEIWWQIYKYKMFYNYKSNGN